MLGLELFDSEGYGRGSGVGIDWKTNQELQRQQRRGDTQLSFEAAVAERHRHQPTSGKRFTEVVRLV